MTEGAATPRLVARGIDKAFGPTVALSRVDLVAQPGEVHAVLGENGAGKSTLMKVLAGALTPDAGTLELDGQPLTVATPQEARAAGIRIVYQEPQICDHLSLAENVMLGVEPTRYGFVDRGAMDVATRQALTDLLGEACGGLAPRALAGTLAPGDRQMVAIARALVGDCRVLILDEPTSSLTAKDAERLFGVVDRLREQGKTILYISHFLEEVERVADAYTVLRDGRSVGTGAIGAMSMAEVVRLMVGTEVEDLFPRSDRTPGEVRLEVTQLVGRPLPHDASLALREGEVLGIAGLVGSGRTELLRGIFGLAPVAGGKVKVGAFVGPASPARSLAAGMGLLSEDRKGEGLAASMTIADNITLSRLDGLGPAGFVLPGPQRVVAEGFADKLRIKCRDVLQPVADLSGGNQQKVALARLLHHDVDVLLLDEPTRGIDVRSRAEVYVVIDRLAAAGKAVLVVSSYLPELFGICDRIAVMRRGRLGEARPVGELDPHGVLVEATGA